MATQFLQIRKQDGLAAVADAVSRQHPRDTAFFGIAADGLPLYLHLGDPRPGPILVAGNPAPLLRCVVHSATQAGTAVALVVTGLPEMWHGLRSQSVVVESDDRRLKEVPFRGSIYPRWLVVIDRYSVRGVEALVQICQWGPAYGIWPIVAVDHPAEVPDAIRPYFGTLIVAQQGNSYQLRRTSSSGWQTKHTFFVPDWRTQ